MQHVEHRRHLELPEHDLALSHVSNRYVSQEHVAPDVVLPAEHSPHGFFLEEPSDPQVARLPEIFGQTQVLFVLNLDDGGRTPLDLV